MLVCLFTMQDAKEDVMHQVGKYKNAAEDEDRQVPAVTEVKDSKSRKLWAD
jgi:hypothetical protein